MCASPRVNKTQIRFTIKIKQKYLVGTKNQFSFKGKKWAALFLRLFLATIFYFSSVASSFVLFCLNSLKWYARWTHKKFQTKLSCLLSLRKHVHFISCLEIYPFLPFNTILFVFVSYLTHQIVSRLNYKWILIIYNEIAMFESWFTLQKSQASLSHSISIFIVRRSDRIVHTMEIRCEWN